MDNCCLNDLFRKEVINIDTGNRYGFVCDVEVNVCTGRISAIILYGKNKFWGFGVRRTTSASRGRTLWSSATKPFLSKWTAAPISSPQRAEGAVWTISSDEPAPLLFVISATI